MADIEEKRKVNRYPMGSPKAARSTIARLTRDLLHGRLDREIYRAACYGLSVLCGLFKLEAPMEARISAETQNRLAVTFMTPEERDKRIEELLTELAVVPQAKPLPAAPEPLPVVKEPRTLPVITETAVHAGGWKPIGIGAARR